MWKKSSSARAAEEAGGFNGVKRSQGVRDVFREINLTGFVVAVQNSGALLVSDCAFPVWDAMIIWHGIPPDATLVAWG